MDKYGLQTWQDYVSLGMLMGFVAFSCAFLVWDWRANRRGRSRR